VRFGPYEILERFEIEGGGFDALVRERGGGEARLWAGRPGSGDAPGEEALHAQRARLAKLFHASVPRVLGAEVHEGRAVLVVAAYRGRRLSERLRDSRLDPPAALDTVRSVAAGLAKAHALDLAHGAVGPDEILLAEDGRALLLHVGMGPFLGARAPRAPVGEAPSDADAYALARVLHECLVGRDPAGAHPDPDELDPALPEGLRRLLARSLDADPARRVRRADELAGDLGVIRASWTVFSRRARRRPSGARLAAWVGGGVAAAVAAAWAIRGCSAGAG